MTSYFKLDYNKHTTMLKVKNNIYMISLKFSTDYFELTKILMSPILIIQFSSRISIFLIFVFNFTFKMNNKQVAIIKHVSASTGVYILTKLNI